jgi:microsomal dipeptidase-like Zn-dependent dipeptidase
MATYFSDLHCHSTLFSLNRGFPDTWYERYFPIFPAQGNFAQLARGNVRVVMVSIYPIEQGFVTAESFGFGTGNITDLLAKVIVDIPKERADRIQEYNHEYFDDLISEINFLQKSALPVTQKVFLNPFQRKTYSYRIVRDFNDLKNLLNLDADLNPGPACDDTIAVVLTIEGAHSLGVGQRNTIATDPIDLKVKLKENIATLKELGPPGDKGAWCPFFITLSHHFWNQLGGHAVSLWKTIRKVLDQNLGIGEGATELGKFVIKELLSTENGNRRILIDSAHMSYELRCWYYGYLAQRGDYIPVIISHTAVNGKATMAEAHMQGDPDDIHDIADELYNQSIEFNPWDDFLSDEEIMIVHNSGGIIGLILDERIMTGKVKLEETKKNLWFKSSAVKRAIWIKPLLDQILHIARHILSETGQPEKIWDIISMGSDFNGMITPVKSFDTADQFPALNDTMFQELKKLKTSEITLIGKTDAEIQEITDKIMWKNNLLFLEKHFV